MIPTADTRQPPLARHFIDLTTSLYFVGQPAIGIVRAEREIARRLLADPRLTAIAIAFWRDQMFILEPADTDLILRNDAALPRSSIDDGFEPAGPASLPDRLRRFARAFARRLLEWTPAYARDDLRLTMVFAWRFLRALRRRTANPAFNLFSGEGRLDEVREQIRARLSVVAYPQPRDVVWTCGHIPLIPLRRLAFQKAQNHFRVVAMAHDVIRIRHPEWNPPDMPRDLVVADTLDLIDTADVVYCNSRDTWRGLSGFAAEAGRTRPRLRLVRLGADLPSSGQPMDDAAVDAELPWLAGKRFALAVGTVEARKNYGLLTKVWQALSEEPDFDLALVIVGRPGGGADRSIAELRSSPLLGKSLFWLEGCPDRLLNALYVRCDLVLCPSWTEGWGLPVTEGLAHGKPVVCSNRGALAEAAMGIATLLDPTDWLSWVDTIRSLARAPSRSTPSVQLPTWDAAADRICRGLLAVSRLTDEG
jgi:glycosyltransferase involved in cell wall biosynthesis